jgi:hypothetical protein
MTVQYLKELMSIYKGTSMKLLMKKSDFSAVVFDGTTLKLALKSHNRPSLTFSTPKCYKIHQGVMLQLQELMSIYKGTSMKLLMKKSDFSAVELRL